MGVEMLRCPQHDRAVLLPRHRDLRAFTLLSPLLAIPATPHRVSETGMLLSQWDDEVSHHQEAWKYPQWLSTVGILGQIVTFVTFVGAGEVRSGVGTLASPMGDRCEAGGKRQGNRTPGDPRVPTLLPCSFHKIPTLERAPLFHWQMPVVA